MSEDRASNEGPAGSPAAGGADGGDSSSALHRVWVRRSAFACGALALCAAVVGYSLFKSEFNPARLFSAGPDFLRFLSDMTPPDWSVSRLIIESTWETLLITLAGTALAVLISFPLGFLAAGNVCPSWITQPVKFTLGFIRSVPLIVVALICVSAVGLGPFPGVIAIAFHSVGMLAKFYAEEFETAEKGILEAVRGSGASWLQTIRFGLVPQCVPQLVSFTVYRFEMNFRDAAVLGLVGAGGIGYYIKLYAGSFQYPKVAVLLIITVIVVTLLDQTTYWVRRWVR